MNFIRAIYTNEQHKDGINGGVSITGTGLSFLCEKFGRTSCYNRTRMLNGNISSIQKVDFHHIKVLSTFCVSILIYFLLHHYASLPIMHLLQPEAAHMLLQRNERRLDEEDYNNSGKEHRLLFQAIHQGAVPLADPGR